MSFLDNLENNLKALESQEQGGVDDRRKREAEKTQALAAAPWADRLKSAPYTSKLMRDVTRAGFSRRMKVNIVWIGRNLRLEALEKRLELEPTSKGIEAVLSLDDGRDRRIPVDLNGEPDELIRTWIEILDRKREELAALASVEVAEDTD